MVIKLTKYSAYLIILILILQPNNSFAQFQHPGIFYTKNQLDFVKSKIQANEEPWKSAYNRLLATNPASREPKPYEVVPGSVDSKERKDMDEMTKDGEYAHACALLWYFTGEKRYADQAIKILNAWSIFKRIPMPLYLTWGTPHFINAAELLKHTPGSGWKQADINKFSTMVRDQMWPRVGPPAVNYGSNHGTTANEAQFAIAIFLDDKAKFDEALTNFRWVAPRYIFMNTPNRINGECNETCRDLNHTKLGVLGLFYAAQAAWNQGVDLWKENETRFATFAELHAGIMTGRTNVPSNMCAYKAGQAGKVFCQGNVAWSSPSGAPPCNETAWEVLYNHLNRRLGRSLPHTEFMLKRNRPLGGITRRNVKWETLLHANMNPNDINVEPVLDPVGPKGYVYSVSENGNVQIKTPVDIAYGADGKFTYLENQRTNITCNNNTFGTDPISGVKKACFIREAKTSYFNNPIAIPGTLEAEHYNYGGKGISYVDETDENQGSVQSNFRINEGVDIAKSGNVIAIGWTQDNEWTEYDLNVTEGGNYQLIFYTSAVNNGGELALYLGNETLSANVMIPSTSSYDEYESFSEHVFLPKGKATLKVEIKNRGFNLDKIVFKKEVLTGIYSSSISDKLDVFPNPSSDGIYHLRGTEKYQIVTLEGKLLIEKTSDLIDLSDQEKGVYLLQINNQLIKLIR